MSRASWSKLGGGRLRRDCPELELAPSSETGAGPWVQAPGEGHVVGLRLHAEAGLRGGAACEAAGRAAAGAQREVLRRHSCCWRTGRPARPRSRCPAGAGRACSPASSPCRVRDRRLRRLQAQRPAPPLPPCQLPPRQPAFQQPCPPRAAASTRRLFSTACAAPRSTPARAAASSRRHSNYWAGYDLWRLRLARTGQHVQAHVVCRVLGQLRAEGLRGCEPAAPAPMRSAAACAPSAELRTVHDGEWPLPAAAAPAGSSARYPQQSGSAVPLVPPHQPHVVRGLCGSAEAVLGLQRRVLQGPRVGVLAGLHKIVQVEVLLTNEVALRSGWSRGSGSFRSRQPTTSSKRGRWLKPCDRSVFIYCCATSPAACFTPGARHARSTAGHLAAHGLRQPAQSSTPTPACARPASCLLQFSGASAAAAASCN